MKTTIIIFLFSCWLSLAQTAIYPLYIGTTNYGQTWQILPPNDVLPDQYWTNQPLTNAHTAAFSLELGLIQNGIVAANQALLTTTNQTAASSNYAAWHSMFTNIPAGINDSSNRIAALGVIYTNLLSGTNTQAQDNAQLTQMAHQQYYSFVYLNQIIAYLSRLGPGLQQVYQPTNDPVGP